MSVVTSENVRQAARGAQSNAPRTISVGLLGFGRIGSAVASLASLSCPHIRLTGALVRHPGRPRAEAPPPPFELTCNPEKLLARWPDVLVEVLGGLEPARSIVTEALRRGIAVVTANKSLMAAHGDELLAISAESGAPLLYEASVIAGVPFLGAYPPRPRVSDVTRLTGIVNGTSNFILSTMEAYGVEASVAVAEAQRLGYAEPDPASDISGIDAAEKLIVLMRHFGLAHVRFADLEVQGIERLQALDINLAKTLGGALKPAVHAERFDSGVHAFAGPVFVPAGHRLARVGGVENAIEIRNQYGQLFYSGPGAGPAPTASTILDDVVEAAAGRQAVPVTAGIERQRGTVSAPSTGWFVRIGGACMPAGEECAQILGSSGVRLRRWSRQGSDREACGFLTEPCTRDLIERVLDRVRSAGGCEAIAFRSLDSESSG